MQMRFIQKKGMDDTNFPVQQMMEKKTSGPEESFVWFL